MHCPLQRRRLSCSFAIAHALVLFVPVVGTAADEAAEQPGRLHFADYPDFKLGFTTQNMLNVMPATPENVRELIDYAASQGFRWIELRDPDARLSLDDCRDLAAQAKRRGIEVAFAAQRSMLDDDFWPVFERSVRRAILFEGPGTVRALASSGDVPLEGGDGKGYSREQLEHCIEMTRRAEQLAARHDLTLVVENAVEPLEGDGRTYFGLTDLFARLGESVTFQLDTANPFLLPSPPSPAAVLAFYRTQADRAVYIHLKSAAESGAEQADQVLGPNVLAFERLFPVMDAAGVDYIAIELQQADSKKAVMDNMAASIEYLKREHGLRR